MKKLYSLVCISLFLGCAGRTNIPSALIQDVTQNKYSEANGVVIFDSTDVKLEGTGKAVYNYHKMVKILSTYGKKKFGEVEFSYVPKFMDVKIEFARLINKEGKIINVSPSEIKDIPFVPMNSEGSGSKMFLSDIRMVKIIFPQIDIGVTIEYKFKITINKPFMKDRFTDVAYFEGDEPVLEKTYRIECPNEIKIKYLVKNGKLNASQEFSKNSIIYNWSQKDIAKILPEPLMPDLSQVATTLIISNIPTWEKVSKWYYDLSVPSLGLNDEIKSKVKELTDTLKTQDLKIHALFDFVSTKIRYLRTEAVSMDKGFEPALATLTFERKWGVCRDKAALLVAMLKEIGVESNIVLLNVSYRTAKEIPTYLFEHAIVAIPKDGKYYYLDPTVEYTMDYFPVMEQNREVLVCDSIGKDLGFAPYENLENNKMITDLKGTLDKNGALKAQLTMSAKGFMDMALRGLRFIPKEQVKQVFEQMIKAYSTQAQLDSFDISEAEDLSAPIKIKLLYSIPEYALKKGNELYIVNAGAATSIGGDLSGMGSPWGLEQRKHPIDFRVPIMGNGTQTLSIPQGYKVKKPRKGFSFESKYLRINFTEKVSGGKLISTSEFCILEPFIPVEKYKELKQVMTDVEQYGKQEIVLIKK
ncbi:MAG: DUF3857 domain-containing protein [bacterium]